MAAKRNHVRLGITVILMGALFFSALFLISGRGLFEEPRRQLVVRFKPVGGMPELSRGAFVVFLGIKIGSVESCDIVKTVGSGDGQQFLEVKTEILESVELRKGCRIVATGPPLGGSGMIEIVDPGVGVPLDHAEVVTGNTVGFQTVVENVSHQLDADNPEGLLYKLNQFAAQLDADNADGMIARINQSIADLNVVTEIVRNEMSRENADMLLGRVHASLALVQDSLIDLREVLADGRPKIASTLAAVDQAARRVDSQILTPLAREFALPETEGPPPPLLAKLHDAMDRVNASMGNIQTTTGNIKQTVAINRGHINDLLQNASAASLALKAGIKDVSLHPWRLLFEPSLDEKRELHLFNVAREFAEASARLDSASARLTDLLAIHTEAIPGDDPDLVLIRSDLAESALRFSEAEQALLRAFAIE